MTLRMRIPGPFVVLQGLPGDGRRNTVQHSLGALEFSSSSDEDDETDVDDEQEPVPFTPDVVEGEHELTRNWPWLAQEDNKKQKQQQLLNRADEPPATTSLDLARTAAALTNPLMAVFSSHLHHRKSNILMDHAVDDAGVMNMDEDDDDDDRVPLLSSPLSSSTSTPPALMDVSRNSRSSDSSTSSSNNNNNTRQRKKTTMRQHFSKQHSTEQQQEQFLLREWHEQCVATANEERQEWLQASLSLNTHCQLSPNTNTNSSASTIIASSLESGGTTGASTSPQLTILEHLEPWWLVDGDLALFDSLPGPPSLSPSDNNNNNNSQPVGTLAPGTTVQAVALITVHSRFPWQRLRVPPLPSLAVDKDGDNDAPQLYPPGRLGQMQILQVQLPNNDNDNNKNCYYVVASVDGYPYLLPGSAEHYVPSNNNKWWWMVTCIEGAYVRSGIDLATPHLCTLPYGALVQVQRQVVNGMGLSRLRVQAVLCRNAAIATTTRSARSLVDEEEEDDDEIVEGWCSEFLNPLSGQRGIVLQPLPFPRPAVYRTVRPLVPIHCDRIQAVVGHVTAPGTLLHIVARQWFEQGVARYQLAGDGGWVDVYNVEYVSIVPDQDFDPDNAGKYHREALQRVQLQDEILRQSDVDDDEPTPGASLLDTSTSTSTEDDADGDPLIAQASAATAWSVPPYSRSRRHHQRNRSRSSRNGRGDNNNACLICLSEERNATMVHGETGHVACCLVCARILKARQDPCPVCRMPIDLVIQHFWA